MGWRTENAGVADVDDGALRSWLDKAPTHCIGRQHLQTPLSREEGSQRPEVRVLIVFGRIRSKRTPRVSEERQRYPGDRLRFLGPLNAGGVCGVRIVL